VSWAKYAIEGLRAGKTVQIRPRGNSMKGKIESGDLVTIAPVTGLLVEGDIVLVTVGCKDYVHLITAVTGGRFQIGNNKGRVNGWVGPGSIHGVVTRVEP